jgi:hypothetical protein
MPSSRYTPALDVDRRTGNVCHICCKTMGDTTTTSCGHTFCSECLTIWMIASNSCPICKQQLITAQQNQGRANLTTQANSSMQANTNTQASSTMQANRTTQDDGDSNCPICMNPIVFPMTTSCGHTFCSGCLTSWVIVGRQDSCPMCRQDLGRHTPPHRHAPQQLPNDFDQYFDQNHDSDFETNNPRPNRNARRDFEAYTRQNRNARRNSGQGSDSDNPRQSRSTRRRLQAIQNRFARRRIQGLRDSFRDFDHAFQALYIELGGERRHTRTLRSISRITDVLNYESEHFYRIFTPGPEESEVNHLPQDEVENLHLALIPLTEECVWLTNQMDYMSTAWREAYNTTSNRRRRIFESLYDEFEDDLIEHIESRRTSIITHNPLPM